MKKLIYLIVLAVASIVFVSCEIPAPSDETPPHEKPQTPKDPEESEKEGLSILFIGNSFTMDAVTHLPGMLQAAGIDDVHMIHMYYGGRIISQYYSGWETSSDYTCYECKPGASQWTTTKGKNLKEVTKSQNWDIVVIQEHTGSKFAWEWNSTALGNFSGLLQCIKSVQEDTPEFHYILSQAYQDMDKIGSGSKPKMTWTDHVGMWGVISSFARNVVETFKFDGIISTGAMLENLRTSSLNNSMGLTRDGYHMDNGLARYGASCTVFESIITPHYNIPLDKNSYRYNVTNTTSGKYTTPVTDASAPVALQAARYAMADPYRITEMSDM